MTADSVKIQCTAQSHVQFNPFAKYDKKKSDCSHRSMQAHFNVQFNPFEFSEITADSNHSSMCNMV